MDSIGKTGVTPQMLSGEVKNLWLNENGRGETSKFFLRSPQDEQKADRAPKRI